SFSVRRQRCGSVCCRALPAAARFRARGERRLRVSVAPNLYAILGAGGCGGGLASAAAWGALLVRSVGTEAFPARNRGFTGVAVGGGRGTRLVGDRCFRPGVSHAPNSDRVRARCPAGRTAACGGAGRGLLPARPARPSLRAAASVEPLPGLAGLLQGTGRG